MELRAGKALATLLLVACLVAPGAAQAFGAPQIVDTEGRLPAAPLPLLVASTGPALETLTRPRSAASGCPAAPSTSAPAPAPAPAVAAACNYTIRGGDSMSAVADIFAVGQ